MAKHYTNIWFVDIKKYLFDLLKSNEKLLDKFWGSTEGRIILRNIQDISLTPLPFITFQQIWSRTNNIWIRSVTFQFDIYSDFIEEWEEIHDIIVDLFNRRKNDWISSKIEREDQGVEQKTWFIRHSLDFQFVFKDIKY
jgi:hypothetical protein